MPLCGAVGLLFAGHWAMLVLVWQRAHRGSLWLTSITSSVAYQLVGVFGGANKLCLWVAGLLDVSASMQDVS